jgi:N-acyl-phosphatidylethanolamine-hydrolysing phospholipase D
VLRWYWQRRRRTLAPDPAPKSIPLAQPLFPQRGMSGELHATWVGHATVLLQLGGTNVLVDPMWSDRASPLSFAGPRRFVAPGIAFDALPPIDVVFVSHNHYDHLDRPTVHALTRRMPGIEWVAPLGLAGKLRQWGAAKTRELDWWQESTIQTSTGPLRAVCVPAQHFSARGFGDRGRSLWCSWVIASGDLRVFFGGDTAYHPEFVQIGDRYGPFDVLMLPIGAYEPRWFMRTVHMNPPEAMRAYAELAGERGYAPIMLPIHWGTFRLTDESMQEPPEWTRRLWREAGYDPAKLWLLRHGETRTIRRSD